MPTKVRSPYEETEPRIMLQILYNLIAYYSKYGWSSKEISRLKRLAKVYVKKTGGITH